MKPGTEPTFHDIAAEVADLVTKKNAAYGSSFDVAGEILRIHYPDGVQPGQYDDLLTLARIFDKTMRIATDRDALGEDPYQDVLGYALLAVRRNRRNKGAK